VAQVGRSPFSLPPHELSPPRSSHSSCAEREKVAADHWPPDTLHLAASSGRRREEGTLAADLSCGLLPRAALTLAPRAANASAPIWRWRPLLATGRLMDQSGDMILSLSATRPADSTGSPVGSLLNGWRAQAKHWRSVGALATDAPRATQRHPVDGEQSTRPKLPARILCWPLGTVSRHCVSHCSLRRN